MNLNSTRTNIIILTVFFTATLGTAWAAHSGRHKTVNGISVYLGVLPSEMMLGHPKEHDESQMHGGIPTDNQYHIMVSLFNNESGRRITDAQVTAAVTDRGHVAIRKNLEPMLLSGTVSYGNYFKIGLLANLHIELSIKLPKTSKPIKLSFDWVRT